MDKVIGGTPQGSHSLCETCRRSHFIRGINMQSAVYCLMARPPMPIKFPVAQCAYYDDKRTPSLYDMQQIAWSVTSRKRGPTGFAQQSAMDVQIEPPAAPGSQPLCPPAPTGNDQKLGRDPVDTGLGANSSDPKESGGQA